MNQASSPSAGPPPLPPPERMDEQARRLRETYAITPDAPLIQKEFGFYCLHRWREQGLTEQADLAAEFGYDPPGDHGVPEEVSLANYRHYRRRCLELGR